MDAIIEKLDAIASLLERLVIALENSTNPPTSDDVERRNRTATGHVDTLEATVGFAPEAAGESAIHAGPNGLGVTS